MMTYDASINHTCDRGSHIWIMLTVWCLKKSFCSIISLLHQGIAHFTRNTCQWNTNGHEINFCCLLINQHLWMSNGSWAQWSDFHIIHLIPHFFCCWLCPKVSLSKSFKVFLWKLALRNNFLKYYNLFL